MTSPKRQEQEEKEQTMSEPSPTKRVAAKVVHAAFEILKENGGEMRSRDVTRLVGERAELDDWAKERYETSGYIRWQTFPFASSNFRTRP